MSYIPTEWHDNEPPAINAGKLNKIEAGIAGAHERIDNIGAYYDIPVTLESGMTDSSPVYRRNTFTGICELKLKLNIKPYSNKAAGETFKVATINLVNPINKPVTLDIDRVSTTTGIRMWSAYLDVDGSIYVRSNDSLTANNNYSNIGIHKMWIG